MMQVTYNLEGVFICDFGLAKFKDVAQGTMTTVTQHMTGTYPVTWLQKCFPLVIGVQLWTSTHWAVYTLNCLVGKEYGHPEYLVCR